MSGVKLPDIERIVSTQACLLEANALLSETASCLIAIGVLKEGVTRNAMVAATEKRAQAYYQRALTRLQEAFYPADDA